MKPNIPLPSRESSSNSQLSALLAITHALQPYLICPPQDFAGQNTQPKIDGGTVVAAANTFVNTCAKIDEILGDKSRWSLEDQDELYEALVEANEANTVFLRTQTAAAASLGRPSYRYRPELVLIKNPGDESRYFYAAVYGELTSNGAVIGYGATPEEAYADFDKAFNRQPHEQKVIQQEPAEQTPAPEKPKRKRKTK